MRRTKMITLMLVLVMSAAGIYAQTPAQILERAERAVYRPGATYADFTSVYYDAQGAETGRTEGRMILQGEHFRLEYGSIVAVFADKTLTHHDSSEQTLTISQPSADELIQVNPLYFLRSRGKGFAVETLPETKVAHVLGFKPQGKSSLKGVEISFLRTSGVPKEILVKGDDGGRLIIKITNIRQAPALEARQFVLTPKQFPGSEVVDLR